MGTDHMGGGRMQEMGKTIGCESGNSRWSRASVACERDCCRARQLTQDMTWPDTLGLMAETEKETARREH